VSQVLSATLCIYIRVRSYYSDERFPFGLYYYHHRHRHHHHYHHNHTSFTYICTIPLRYVYLFSRRRRVNEFLFHFFRPSVYEKKGGKKPSVLRFELEGTWAIGVPILVCIYFFTHSTDKDWMKVYRQLETLISEVIAIYRYSIFYIILCTVI